MSRDFWLGWLVGVLLFEVLDWIKDLVYGPRGR